MNSFDPHSQTMTRTLGVPGWFEPSRTTSPGAMIAALALASWATVLVIIELVARFTAGGV